MVNVNRERGLFLSVYVDDIKLVRKKQNINPMWKVLMKQVDLGEPTSFLDHVHLGCTQRECKTTKKSTFTEICFNPGSPQEQNKSYLVQGDLTQTSTCPMMWKVRQRNVWKDIVSWRTKGLNNSTKYPLHALMTVISKKKK